MKSKRFPVGTGGGRHPERAAIKREEATKRNDYYASLTPERRLANLDHRLGRGLGASRQRARLARELGR
jgi:hypothetical protein